MPDLTSIPGGAQTQVAQNAGNPENVGLTADQAQQARDMYDQSIAQGNTYTPPAPQGEPIPVWGPEGDPYAQGQEAPQEPSQAEGMEIPVTLPNGTPITAVVDQGTTMDELRYMMEDRFGEEGGFIPGGSSMDRVYAGTMVSDNIVINAGEYLRNRFPFLDMKYMYTPDGGFELLDPGEQYGADYYSLSPEARGQRRAEINRQQIEAALPGVHTGNLGTEGKVGGAITGVLDPANLVAGGSVVKGVKAATGIAGATLRSAGVGAAWGGAYGASKVLAEKGAPTSLEEVVAAAPVVAENAAWGAAGGAVLGAGGRAVKNVYTKRAIKKDRLLGAGNAEEFGKQTFWPEVWQNQAKGMNQADAIAAAQGKFGMTVDDMWRVNNATKAPEVELKNLRPVDLLDSKTGNAPAAVVDDVFASTHRPATDQLDAMVKLADNEAAKYGDAVMGAHNPRFFDSMLRPIAAVVKDVSPRLYKRLVDMEGNVLRKTHEYHETFGHFFKSARTLAKKATPADSRAFAKALYNNKDDAARAIWRKYGMDMEHYNAMRRGMEKLEGEMKAAGAVPNTIEWYFPRIMKDYDGFLAATHQDPDLKGLAKVLEKARKDAAKRGEVLTEAKKAQIINRYMEPVKRKSNKKTVRSEKRRSVKAVNDKILEYYHDPVTSLEFHLREAVSKVERAAFFGKALRSENGVDDLGKSIGELMVQEGIMGKQAELLQRVLNARFGKGEQAGKAWLSALRQGTGGVTLGNPISAIRQLGDIPTVMRMQGVTNTLVSMFRKAGHDIDAETLGYMHEMAQELDTMGTGSAKVRAAAKWLYDKGQFRRVDHYSKNVLIKAAVRKAMQSQKNPKQQMNFIKKYGGQYDKEDLVQLMRDLKEGNMTDLVKSHINAEVMRVQPVSRSQMPALYLEHPNMRLMYQFRTWGLNQMELMRTEVLRGMFGPGRTKSERMQAAGAGLLWLAGIGTTNTAITQLQRFLTDRETMNMDEIPTEAIWQTIGNFGLGDKYTASQFSQSGDVEDLLRSFIPPSLTIPGNMVSKPIAAAAKGEAPPDVAREMLKQSGIGRMVDWWFMGGAEEYNQKLQKRRGSTFDSSWKGSGYAQ